MSTLFSHRGPESLNLPLEAPVFDALTDLDDALVLALVIIEVDMVGALRVRCRRMCIIRHQFWMKITALRVNCRLRLEYTISVYSEASAMFMYITRADWPTIRDSMKVPMMQLNKTAMQPK